MSKNLISREWLEDAFDNLCCHDCKKCRNFRIEDSFYKCALIDNAPTVEDNWKFYYEHGYAQAKKDFDRPTGEWIEGKNGTIKCNQCGCEIKYYYLIGNKPDLPKFCCDCGAKMRGGEEE